MTIVSTTVRVSLARPDDIEGWRAAARRHLDAGTPPESLVWVVAGSGTADLFGEADDSQDVPSQPAAGTATATVPRGFLDLAERVVCHRDDDRFALLYRTLWRLTHGEPRLLESGADDDVLRLHRLGKCISRERHKTHAFVRFRQTPGVQPEHFGAWFEPEHHTLRLSSGFFVRRFANMHWSIVTPEESAHWDGATLQFGPGGHRSDEDGDAMEALWRTYFANIFNPARLRLDAMRSEMPVKYWKNLPEAGLIADLVHAAGQRTTAMIDARASEPPRFANKALHVTSASETRPDDASVLERCVDLETLHARTRSCTRCAHACRTTQAVNGEGAHDAPLMLIGEQPGDREDLVGRPFIGPAGALLRDVLDELDIAHDRVFMTNAVRHFHHEARGKRRLHRRPTVEHVSACRPWLFEEIRLVQPRAVLALGATAARALLDRPVEIGAERLHTRALNGATSLAVSYHPAAILRHPDPHERASRRASLVADLADAWHRTNR